MLRIARARRRLAVIVCVALACALLPSAVGAYDWLQFNGDGRHGGNNTQETEITAANVGGMQRLFQITLPSNADSAPVALGGVVGTPGGTADLVFVTTRAGHLIALNGRTGAAVWSVQHGSSTCQINNPAPVANPTNPCHTNASPAIDPNRQFIYAYGLDGFVHKHQVATGAEVTGGGWPELATRKPFNEKGSSALGIATTPGGTFLYVANGGYPGDAGDYQGHLTTINLATGAQHVFNALCSNLVDVHFAQTPGTPDCAGQTRSAIWARPGAVYDASTGKIYMATGNGTFDPANHHWGDTVFALNPDGTGLNGNPLDTYTPANQSTLNALDQDLGSAAPAILPAPGCGVPNLAVQGGKDGLIRLLNLGNLSGQGGPGHTGGEIAGPPVAAPGNGLMLTAPAVWVNPADNTTWAFLSTTGGIGGTRLTCAPGSVTPSLQTIWQHTAAGMGSTSSPLVANGVLYAATNNGVLSAFNPTTGGTLWATTVGSIHWESPLVANGILYLPDQSNHLTAFSPLAIATVTPITGLATGGTGVTITGTGFDVGTTVSFGGVATTNVAIVNNTTITATAPAHAPGPVDVTVRHPDGTVATLPGGFTFAPESAPAPRPSGGTTVPGSSPPPPPGRPSGAPTAGPTPVPIPTHR